MSIVLGLCVVLREYPSERTELFAFSVLKKLEVRRSSKLEAPKLQRAES